MTRTELLELAASGEFDRLVGLVEETETEFKRQPFDLATVEGKFELAKDVSALANGAGGVLLLGASTRRDEHSRQDVVRKLSLFAHPAVDIEQHAAVIASYVYPSIDELSIEWKPSVSDRSRGALVIDVPPQSESKKLFLVSQPVVGGAAVGYVFGAFIRRGSTVEHLGIEEIHLHIRDGRGIDARLAGIEVRLDEISQVVTGVEVVPPDQTVMERISQTLEGS